MRKRLTLALLSVLIVCACNNEDKTAVPSPPMGWNSWICYGTSVTEAEVLKQASFMADNLLKYGWEYVVIDAGWYAPGMVCLEDYLDPCPEQLTDSFGRLVVDTDKYPSAIGGKGLKPLADAVHEMGLKLGIHIMRGIPIQAWQQDTPVKGTKYTARDISDTLNVCDWYHGFYGIDMDHPAGAAYYSSLFELYKEWGIDYVKADDLLSPEYSWKDIEAISHAAADNGIILSLSPGPAPVPKAEHLRKMCALWRISEDFWDDWSSLKKQFPLCEKWAPHTGEGHWADADMLPIGDISIRGMRGGPRKSAFSAAELRTMITLWAMFKSPLMLGGDLTGLDEDALAMITNKEIIDLDQKSRGGRQIYCESDCVIWSAEKDNNVFLAVFNTGDTTLTYPLDISIAGDKKVDDMKEIWSQRILFLEEGKCVLDIPAHDVMLLKI